MSKKGFGKLIALTAVAGAAAAGISYFKKYQSFNKELDEEFHDFEDEEEAPVPDSTMNRKYVSLNANKDELLVAAGDMVSPAKDVAGAAKNVMKDPPAIVADTTREAMGAAAETASRITFSEEKDEEAEEAKEPAVTEEDEADAVPADEAEAADAVTEEDAEEATAPQAEAADTPADTIEVAIDADAEMEDAEVQETSRTDDAAK